MKLTPLLLAACSIATPALAGAQEPATAILQLYSYHLVDPPRFREGYRAHLGWHARHRDPLAWYAWTVQAGPRRGQFIDGTAGASLAGLDARPDLPGDGADFVATVGDSAQPIDVETWALWAAPTTATPLEDRKPGKTVDVFLLTVSPGHALAFERAVARLAQKRRAGGAQLSWYRRLRGGGAASYMLLVARERWADIAANGGTLPEILSRAYGARSAGVEAALAPVEALATETWTYEPRLSLLPGEPFAS
ncbi:MAG: hypothetical protein ABI810_10865 [Sphingomonas bacterium]